MRSGSRLMNDRHFNYDEMVQNALRGVVRAILTEVLASGLPGQHHFYIAFRTRAPGVLIPEHLKKRYPDEMTIVLQHRFWGLEVHDDHFVIGLSFNHKPEKLIIPYKAITGIVDPSVQFALQFQEEGASDEPAVAEAPPPEPANPAEPAPENAPDDGDGKVVTLDAFRKKP